MGISLPPVPHKVPMTDQSGHLNQAWSKWFRDMFVRIGGTVAPSNTELVSEVDIAGINQDIQDLQDADTAFDVRVTVLEGLGVGRQL